MWAEQGQVAAGSRGLGRAQPGAFASLAYGALLLCPRAFSLAQQSGLGEGKTTVLMLLHVCPSERLFASEIPWSCAAGLRLVWVRVVMQQSWTKIPVS